MVGQTISHYKITEKLGEGGMGVVYKALDAHLDRPVAIKVLRAEAVADPERKRRFVQEARAASALNHPAIITIHDIDRAACGSQELDFIVMEYVPGKTIRQRVSGRGLALEEAVRYAIDIADALAAAHAAGIVHRDIKPANIMVSDSGRIKVLDFGLAKLTEPVEVDAFGATESMREESPRTQEGMIVGSVAYMSPEQALGKKVDFRSDIFSFGSLLYEMIAGRRAFPAQNRLEALAAIVRDEPERLSAAAPAAPLEMERLIARAMRKDLERRWQSMADVRVALMEIREAAESGVSTAGLPGPALGAGAERKRPAGRRRLWGLAAALAATAVVGAALWLGIKAAPPALKTLPFTSFPGYELAPAFSPEGNQVAFVWNGEKGGGFDIYVKLIGAGAPFRLTANPADEFSPAWSPDGRHIAFYRQSEAGSGVFLVGALGGPERKLGQSAVNWFGVFRFGAASRPGLAWAPSGKLLAIVDKESPGDPDGLFGLATETGEKRRLTSPPAHFLGDWFPAFSPDGQTLAFNRVRSDMTSDLHVVPVRRDGASGGEPKRLTFDERWIAGLDWDPDGGSLIFSSNRAGGQSLWRMAAAGGAPERLAVGGDNAYFPSLARRGQRLAYEQSLAETNIWRTAGPAFTGRAAPPVRLISSTRLDNSPQYSSDGKRITFQSTRSGNEEIWVCDSEGLNAVQLTSFGGASVGSPRWSPDGQRVVFDSRKEGQGDVYVVGAEGGAPRRLTEEASDEVRPSWSRDGRWIYFGSNRQGGAWQVWKALAEGGPARQVTSKGGREAFESPDGKFVYYTRLNVAGVWRVPVEGGEEVQVLDQGNQGRWALLQQGVCLLNPDATPAPVLAFFSFAARRLAPLATLPEGARFYGGPSLAVSPDGRWMLYVQFDQTESDILLVENFR